MGSTNKGGGHEQGRGQEKGGGGQDSHQNARAGERDKAIHPGDHAGWSNEREDPKKKREHPDEG